MRNKPLKVTVTLEFEGDPNDEDEVEKSIYEILQEQIDEGALEFHVEVDDENDGAYPSSFEDEDV